MRLGLAAVVVLLALPASSAMAGRMLVTGHDADFHCGWRVGQCHFVEVATRYVRAGAPDPAKPVLVLDRGDQLMARSLDNAFGIGAVPRVVLDPRGAAFAAEPLLTSRYSAILVASDESCGGCGLNEPGSTPDSDALAARAADIRAFFNGGGGLYVNSGAERADGDPAKADVFYRFLPFPLAGRELASLLRLTSAGESLGFVDGGPDSEDIQCCTAHNGFEPPALGTLGIAERDRLQTAVTVFVEGRVGPRPGEPPRPAGAPEQEPPPPGPAPAPPAQFSADTAPPPVAGESMVVKPAGRVLIQLPRVPGAGGEPVKQPTLQPLTGTANVPMGAILDTTRGTLSLTSTAPGKGSLQSADFFAGVFKVLQRGSPARPGTTELVLSGGGFGRACGARSSARSRGGKSVRRLWGRGKGSFRTRGRYSATSVRGTEWLTEDRCNGTLTRVKQGTVTVRDLVKRRNVVVRAPNSYLARSR